MGITVSKTIVSGQQRWRLWRAGVVIYQASTEGFAKYMAENWDVIKPKTPMMRMLECLSDSLGERHLLTDLARELIKEEQSVIELAYDSHLIETEGHEYYTNKYGISKQIALGLNR